MDEKQLTYENFDNYIYYDNYHKFNQISKNDSNINHLIIEKIINNKTLNIFSLYDLIKFLDYNNYLLDGTQILDNFFEKVIMEIFRILNKLKKEMCFMHGNLTIDNIMCYFDNKKKEDYTNNYLENIQKFINNNNKDDSRKKIYNILDNIKFTLVDFKKSSLILNNIRFISKATYKINIISKLLNLDINKNGKINIYKLNFVYGYNLSLINWYVSYDITPIYISYDYYIFLYSLFLESYILKKRIGYITKKNIISKIIKRLYNIDNIFKLIYNLHQVFSKNLKKDKKEINNIQDILNNISMFGINSENLLISFIIDVNFDDIV
jgi:hypothetical protein